MDPVVKVVRCPVRPSTVFMRLHVDPDVRVVPGNLIEVACRDCRRNMQKDGQRVTLVLHRYNPVGELVETEVVE